ncbi:NADH dehydrogenase subunit L [Thiohalobacter sp. COW1]|uniref:proton-conducting transporter transmembrane domain-containing protein n=1 Tax=Thiohalobacter sp. COW1 TaxID=2795687 RepID=UPI001914ECC8|nr:proton-conducting transporter membrane subunit [Thiohalobacter sp. COW1]BCO30152.1 NADH dehydrogenase subunit L [Thiohalobacter sp. COW1]
MMWDTLLSPGILILVSPLLLGIVGLLPDRLANDCPLRMSRLVQAASLSGVLVVVVLLLAALTQSSDVTTYQLFGAQGGDAWASAFSVMVDSLSLTILALVALLTALVARFSTQYLLGDARHGSFFRWLALTAGAFMLVVIAGDLLTFALAIILTGTGLNRLLTYYSQRQPAQMVAHKKLLFSRGADACLLAATLLIGFAAGTLSFEGLAAAVSRGELVHNWQLHLAAWLIVGYAVLKTGQFPFHGWLLQVMEAPTPVSALLHAGIVYSGPILILRTHELLLADGIALVLLLLVGLVTVTLASLAMLTQTAIKSSLAWSTAGQLGFMLVELGLGLFVLALLHLLAHSLYKAHAFLSSGSIVDQLRAPAPAARGPVTAGQWLAVLAASALVTFGVAALWGITPATEPALLALGTILSVALAQLLASGQSLGLGSALWLRLGGLSALVAAVYFGLHSLFAHLYSGVLSPIPHTAGVSEYALIVLVAAVFLGLSFLQSVLIPGSTAPWLQRLYVHLYNGLYIDLPVERLVYRIWPARFRGTHRRAA